MSRILIVYYSVTGRTRQVAELIQKTIGGNLVSIRTKVPYSNELLARWKDGHREVKDEILPELNDFPVDLNQYDVIFLGTPVWWYSVALPMKKFLLTHDLSGKIIFPFLTGDNAAGNAFYDLVGTLENCFVKTGLQVRFIENRQITPDWQIQNWAKTAAEKA